MHLFLFGNNNWSSTSLKKIRIPFFPPHILESLFHILQPVRKQCFMNIVAFSLYASCTFLREKKMLFGDWLMFFCHQISQPQILHLYFRNYQIHMKIILSKMACKFPKTNSRQASLCSPSTESLYFKMSSGLWKLSRLWVSV